MTSSNVLALAITPTNKADILAALVIDFDEAYYDPEAYPFFVQHLHHVALRDEFDNYHVDLVALHEMYTADENPDYDSRVCPGSG